MATALARGCVQAGLTPPGNIYASDPSRDAGRRFADTIPGTWVVSTNHEVLAAAQLVVLAVKPQVMDEVLTGLARYVTKNHLLVSIAAGIPLARLARPLPQGTRLVRVMPNTPCLVGMGASGLCRGADATENDAAAVSRLLASVGVAYEVAEEQLDAVTGLSGSGPAFVYTFIEALAAGGVRGGLPSELALALAVQTTRGAAQMLVQTGESPEELRGQVTSPGGTTLAGLETLARLGGAAAVEAAVESATARSRELGSTSGGT
jgi:pyrroline-5-carboxylate reductase